MQSTDLHVATYMGSEAHGTSHPWTAKERLSAYIISSLSQSSRMAINDNLYNYIHVYVSPRVD